MEFEGIAQVGPADAARLMDEGGLMLDVREADERAAASIPGTVFIPMSQLVERVEELPRDKPVVVQCASGARSQQVARWLASQGYEASNLAGGIKAWHHVGLPVVHDA